MQHGKQLNVHIQSTPSTGYFMFIKSVRIGDFDTFLECLKAIPPWFFALDHTQYSRWKPVFIQDFSTLERDHNGTYKAFQKGLFTVRKANCIFFQIWE